MNYARVQALGVQTDMTEAYEQTATNQTDVLGFTPFMGGAVRGDYRCVRITSSGLCDQAHVRLNRTVLDPESANSRTKTACHEVGHSVALDHSGEAASCLIEGPSEQINYSAHDKGHINGRY